MHERLSLKARAKITEELIRVSTLRECKKVSYTGASAGFLIVGILSEHWLMPEYNFRTIGR